MTSTHAKYYAGIACATSIFWASFLSTNFYVFISGEKERFHNFIQHLFLHKCLLNTSRSPRPLILPLRKIFLVSHPRRKAIWGFFYGNINKSLTTSEVGGVSSKLGDYAKIFGIFFNSTEILSRKLFFMDPRGRCGGFCGGDKRQLNFIGNVFTVELWKSAKCSIEMES